MTSSRLRLLVPAGRESTADAGYSPGVLNLDNGLVFIAGHTGLDRANQAIADPEQQFMAIFERIAPVLEAAGASFADVIDMTSFHVSFDTIETFMEVKARYLIGSARPAWTAVGVTALGVPGCLVEVKMTAAGRVGQP